MCLLCRRWRGALCSECVQRWAAPQARCQRCALAVGGSAQPRCGDCLRHVPAFDACSTLADYGFPWDGLVTALKFNARPEVARPLGQALAQRLAQDQRQHSVDLILPVPLGSRRLRERGYNQAWELARAVARQLGLPAHADVLQRLRDTPAQTGLTRAERERNLRDLMWVPPQAMPHVAGRAVALVDDVLTTGATANAASAVLKQAGAASVQVWVLARTPRPLSEPDL